LHVRKPYNALQYSRWGIHHTESCLYQEALLSCEENPSVHKLVQPSLIAPNLLNAASLGQPSYL